MRSVSRPPGSRAGAESEMIEQSGSRSVTRQVCEARGEQGEGGADQLPAPADRRGQPEGIAERPGQVVLVQHRRVAVVLGALAPAGEAPAETLIPLRSVTWRSGFSEDDRVALVTPTPPAFRFSCWEVPSRRRTAMLALTVTKGPPVKTGSSERSPPATRAGG